MTRTMGALGTSIDSAACNSGTSPGAFCYKFVGSMGRISFRSNNGMRFAADSDGGISRACGFLGGSTLDNIVRNCMFRDASGGRSRFGCMFLYPSAPTAACRVRFHCNDSLARLLGLGAKGCTG